MGDNVTIVYSGPPSVTVSETSPDVAATSQGPQGIPGPPGPVGGTFVFNQMTPSATWTVTHNLGYYPSTTVVDSSGDVVLGDVQYVSLDEVIITFSAPFSGTAYFS